MDLKDMLRKQKEANRTRHEKTNSKRLHEESEIVNFYQTRIRGWDGSYQGVGPG